MFVVSSDKDMMQLVNERVCVLNPPKDNLICDAAKVEEFLGVPPERVVDVMALRGDAIDNIPGAPGIGDKGSVELIQRFGTRREPRWSMPPKSNARPIASRWRTIARPILLSKELVTIDRNVAVEFEPEKMRAQEPDADCRTRAVHRAGIHHAGAGLPDRERRTGRDAIIAKPRARPTSKTCSAERRRREQLWRSLSSRAPSSGRRHRKRPKRKAELRRRAALVRRCTGRDAAAPPKLRVAISGEPDTALSLTLDDSEAGQALRRSAGGRIGC